jgi:hypothetical protein
MLAPQRMQGPPISGSAGPAWLLHACADHDRAASLQVREPGGRAPLLALSW